MGWDDSGNNGSSNGNRDPWGNQGKNRGSNNDGPPDLDELARKLQERVNSLFGGGGSNRSGNNGSGSGNAGWAPLAAIGLVLFVLAEIYSSIQIIEEGNRGVVLRFGRYVETLQPGFNMVAPWPIDYVEEVNVDKFRVSEYDGTMLTHDENIVDLDLTVQYKIADPKQYLFQVIKPEQTMTQVTASAIREVVGSNDMDFVIKDGRAAVADQTKELLQTTLDRYDVGLNVISVNLKESKAPSQVQAAFEDAIKAREDKERQEREAETYRNNVLPRARGGAARQRQEAEAYRDSLIATAEGEASRFTQLLAAYEKAPKIHRERLYLETIEEVFGNTNKVMVDIDGDSNPLLYIPLDQLVKGGGVKTAREVDGGGSLINPQTVTEADAAARRSRDNRARGNR